jgi:hypothetical protein
MNNEIRNNSLRMVAALGLVALTVSAAPNEPLLRQWSERAQMLVRAMTEKYGIPNRLDAFEAVWYDNGPWRRTVVHRDSWSRFLGARDNDFLEQTIEYRVDDKKIRDIQRFHEKIQVDQSAGELSSRAETESLNFLALNLAKDIADGKRSVKSARDFYAKTDELARSGKSSPYLEGFGFTVDGVKVPEPEKPAGPEGPAQDEFH